MTTEKTHKVGVGEVAVSPNLLEVPEQYVGVKGEPQFALIYHPAKIGDEPEIRDEHEAVQGPSDIVFGKFDIGEE